MLKNLTDQNVDSVLASDRTFLALFKDGKSPNTENVLKIFEEFNEKFQEKIDVYVCEYAENPKVMSYFKTRVLPAVTMLKRNKIYANITGVVSATQYNSLLADGIRKIMEDEEAYNALPDNEYTL